MKIYFLSATPCALFINDLYFGVTDKFERHAEITLSDGVYLRFCPENAQPNGFFLTENIRFQPPAGVRVYLLKNAIALYCETFPPNDHTLKIFSQQKIENTLATLFSQGELYLSLQTEKQSFIATLPPSFTGAKLTSHENLLFVETENMLAIYTKTAEKLFEEKILSYRVEKDTLYVRLPLFDSLSRIADCTYLLSETRCAKQSIEIQSPADAPPFDNVAYMFFESLLIGANYEDFLSDELVQEKEKLRLFLGDYEGVFLTEERDVCGLIVKKGERLYEARYYKIKTEKGKITEIEG